MLKIPNDLYEKLEFDKVLELLKRQCLGELGRERIKTLPLHQSEIVLKQLLEEVLEFKITLEQHHHFPIRQYEAIDKEMRMLEIVDYVLPIDGLQRINTILRQIEDFFKFFKKQIFRERYPTLHGIVKSVSLDDGLQREINRVIDEKGQIRSDASPELLRIRKRTLSKIKDLDRKFRSIIQEYQGKGWLKDTVESFRNGRRVLAVMAEYKRQIRGIIHDESATGRTAFIEPEAIIQINNDIFDLEQEEKREIYRILKQLSNMLRPYLPALEQYQALITRFDVIQAKAKIAVDMNAYKPRIQPFPFIGIRQGYHPLLFLKNKKEGKKTVPLSLVFRKDNRILMLSGPNAGGKSVAMKAVGLMQLMVQAGMLIPANPSTEIGIFEQIFADIGDQQSLEDDLSTYSSRLRNARLFLQHANDKTLVLIDEFGSGTDPKIGGAIAEAILNTLNKRKVFGIITTHYSNLKVFAFKNEGIINGSMTFDRDNFTPTFEMKVGRPGSSYAFEIAQKSGLPKKILNYAKHKTGKNEKAVDQLLVDLQREKQAVETQLQILKEKEESLGRLIKTYEQMHTDLQYNRKKLKLETKEKALQNAAQTNQQLQRLVRELREAQNLEKAKQIAQQAREERKKLTTEVTELVEDIYYKAPTSKTKATNQKNNKKKGDIKVGDFVRLKTGGATGKVESIHKKKVVIQVGMLRMTVKLRDLQHANEPLEVRKQAGIQSNISSNSETFEAKLDIRGLRRDEALSLVQRFMDHALISSATLLRIIHGKGNGVLRKAVRQKLNEYNDVKGIRHEDDKYGGDGVTIVELG